MGRRANELVRHSQQADMTCLGQSYVPRTSGPYRSTVWPLFVKKMTRDDRLNWCFKYSIDIENVILLYILWFS
jgi:hypothetical protein